MIDIEHLPSKYLVSADQYETIKNIGEGTYGSVKLVREKATGKIYAKKNIIFEDGDELGAPLYFFRECLSLRDSQVPGLPFLFLKGFNFPSKDEPAFIVTEYVDGGSLETLLNHGFEDHEDAVTIKMKIIFGIAFALKFLHLKDIIHRDLKPANVLLDKKREPYLADFGFARQISNDDPITGGIGTPEYMAPELLDEDFIDSDKSIDVYSFAVIVLEIITGSLKINGKRAHKIVNKRVKEGKRFDIPHNVPNSFKKMIVECWDGNPSKRWTMDEVVYSLQNGNLILPGYNKEVYDEYVNRLTKIFEQAIEDHEEIEDIDPTPPFDFS